MRLTRRVLAARLCVFFGVHVVSSGVCVCFEWCVCVRASSGVCVCVACTSEEARIDAVHHDLVRLLRRRSEGGRGGRKQREEGRRRGRRGEGGEEREERRERRGRRGRRERKGGGERASVRGHAWGSVTNGYGRLTDLGIAYGRTH
eukprot:3842307-Rhodomonas_salina.1